MKNMEYFVDKVENFNKHLEDYKVKVRNWGYTTSECETQGKIKVDSDKVEILKVSYTNFYVEPTMTYYLEEPEHKKLMEESLELIANLKENL